MADRTATVTTTIRYTKGDGSAGTITVGPVACKYGEMLAEGEFEIAADALDDAVYDIPWGNVEKPTLLVIENDTAFDVKVSLHGTELFKIGPGAFQIPIASAQPPNNCHLSGASIKLTSNQTEVGHIKYHLFGDPAPLP